MFFVSTWAQDIITFRDGQSVKAQVTEVSDTSIKYRLADNPNGPLYTKNTSDIFSITYQNGKTETFKAAALPSSAATTSASSYSTAPAAQNVNIDPDLEGRLRRLKVWSKVLKIYGWIVTSGGVALTAACIAEGETDFEVLYSPISATAIGTTSLIIGYHLSGKRKRLMRQNGLVGAIPVVTKEYKIGDCTLAPSVNLMSYNNNPAQGVGAGLTISF